MKKILLLCCLLMSIGGLCRAQSMIPKLNPEERAKHWQTKLKLSDAQTSKITGFYKILVVQMDSVATAGGENDGDSLQALMNITKAKIQAVLTPKQNIYYEKLLKEEIEKSDENTPQPQSAGSAGAAPVSKGN